MSKYVMWQPEPMGKEEAIAAMAARVEAVKATEVDGKVRCTPRSPTPFSPQRLFVSKPSRMRVLWVRVCVCVCV